MKVYFKYEPNNFSIYDNIDKYGDLSFKHASSFDVSEEDNYIIFVGNAIKLFGKTIYFSGIRELITNQKFTLDMYNLDNDKGACKISISSDKLGFYNGKKVKLSDSLIKRTKVTGFLKYLKENREVFEKYFLSLDKFFNDALLAKYEYNKVNSGPSNEELKAIRNDVKKLSR